MNDSGRWTPPVAICFLLGILVAVGVTAGVSWFLRDWGERPAGWVSVVAGVGAGFYAWRRCGGRRSLVRPSSPADRSG